MENYPRVCEEAGSLSVEFAPDGRMSRRVPLTMVIDLGQDGDVLGIEILDLVSQTGKESLGIIRQAVRTDGGGLRYAYDDDSESFYLQLRAGRSVDQKALEGFAFLDDLGQILGIGVNL